MLKLIDRERMKMKTYGTSDFYLACFLKYYGYKILRLESEGQRRIFIFEDADDREKLVMQYFNDEASVSPLAFTATIRDMKGLLHQS